MLLAAAVVVSAFAAWMWRSVVIAGSAEGAEASVKRGVASAFWASVLMIVAFLTLELFARYLAVWYGYGPGK